MRSIVVRKGISDETWGMSLYIMAQERAKLMERGLIPAVAPTVIVRLTEDYWEAGLPVPARDWFKLFTTKSSILMN